MADQGTALVDCKNITELYELGYHSILLCRDCWQTNYIQEDDMEPKEIQCMCGKKYKLFMEHRKYDYMTDQLLWFNKPERVRGINKMPVWSQVSTPQA